MGLFDRMKNLIHWLRAPQRKPPVTADLDARLDRAEERLDRLADLADTYQRGDRALSRR